jgi:hypothetical protein
MYNVVLTPMAPKPAGKPRAHAPRPVEFSKPPVKRKTPAVNTGSDQGSGRRLILGPIDIAMRKNDCCLNTRLRRRHHRICHGIRRPAEFRIESTNDAQHSHGQEPPRLKSRIAVT